MDLDLAPAIEAVRGFFAWLAGFAPSAEVVWWTVVGLVVLFVVAWAYRGRRK
ncbi:MAG: hypothetical protein JSV86_12885 [Gemmatimonadota bacterium]|nr:MAG: hypothetical protein JSV86_12885 [Gemmatimonadota bacterium]